MKKLALKKLVSALLLLAVASFFFPGCTQYEQQGAGVGAAVGGIAGALLARNPWEGGVIGGALGAVAGATLVNISERANQQAVQTGQPVEYTTNNGEGIYRAEPESEAYYPNAYTKCRKVHERVWDNGRLVRDRVREVCTSVSERPGY
ncbi:MAG: glycine zipper 2TM domain-containing protein [Nitrospiraceae bacterium]|nr:glycine zipper 2TM domain-containing protein [Nitrospiraceae bacterium]